MQRGWRDPSWESKGGEGGRGPVIKVSARVEFFRERVGGVV